MIVELWRWKVILIKIVVIARYYLVSFVIYHLIMGWGFQFVNVDLKLSMTFVALL
jgi:hypothetical protein